MAHSLVQEMTMVTDVTNLEEAEALVSHMKDMVQDEGEDPAGILEEMGIRPLAVWIAELDGSDDNLDLEQDSDLEYD